MVSAASGYLWGSCGEKSPKVGKIKCLTGTGTYLLKLSIPAQDTGGNPRKRQKLLDRSIT